MAAMYDFLWIIVIFVNFIITQIEGGTRSVSPCLPPAQNTFNIQCGSGYMVRITKSFYGFNSRRQCGFQIGDCIYEDHQIHSCVGRESCTLSIPNSNNYIPECNKDSNYYQIDYECVLASDSYNICETPLITKQQGYVKTPNYPEFYRFKNHCITNIRVESYQTIKLHVIDMDLEDNGSYGCTDWMYVKDRTRSVTLCGRKGNEPLAMSSSELLIQFNTNSTANHKGFWLYFEENNLVSLDDYYTSIRIQSIDRTMKGMCIIQSRLWHHARATPSITTTTIKPTTPTPPKTTVHDKSKDQTIPITRHFPEPEKKLPFAEIVGGVIGTLSLVLVILLVLLAVKWYKERRRRDNKNRFMEVQNPAYRNSTEFRQSRTEPCYNYMDV